MKLLSSRILAKVGSGCALLLATLFPASASALPRKGKLPPDLAEVLSRMSDAGKRLKTLSANLEYTKVTVLVDDKSTESGQFFLHRSKNPRIAIKMVTPDPKTILFTKNRAQVFNPKTNQIQEYNIGQHSGLVQEFFLLGFGTDPGNLTKSYKLKLVGEEELDGDSTVVLELTPQRESVATHISKVNLWISEESWLPVQQKFFEPDGDYVVARYTSVKVNRAIPPSTFQILAPGAERVRMN